ncbi:cell wall metabolism sensor histidine kinase VicK, partial [bacterium]|nr:cell wall metabolism sensor histidine kinase VicK [bacterium]
AKIEISDTGIGISKEDLPKIFDRFFHKDTLEGNNSPGNGLGLTIAMAIAKMHNGDIKAYSEYGKGSKFSVILPVREKH